ncbi:histidine kinase [Winogradskyella sp. PE311]|uniref:sensor histidine kinase n=1 Tax=Winogradskyella sp. PE311 TaxID=3366943 RepID=UPI0039811F2B
MNNVKFHISTIVLFLIWNFSFSQNYTNYTTKDGLPSNLVYRITQDQDGFIWVITDKGISKFDGYTFKNFTIKEGLPTNDIWNVRITPDNKVWYFSEIDALGYIQTDSVHSYKTSGGKVMMPMRINQSGNSIELNEAKYKHQFKKNVWQEIPMDITNFKLQYKGLRVILGPDAKLQLKIDSNEIVFQSKGYMVRQAMNYQLNDSLYVLRNDEFYELINLKTFASKYIVYKNQNGFYRALKNARFHLVSNGIQVTGNNNLIVLDKNLNWSKHYKIPSSLKSHFSFKDKEGWIWVATFTNGIYKLPKNYDKINRLFEGKRLSSINNIDGVMYVGVIGEGVYKVTDTILELQIPYSKYTYDVVKIKDRIIYVLESDIYIEEEGDFKHIKRSESNNFGKRFVNYKSNLVSEGFLSIYEYSIDESGSSRVFDDRNYSGIFVQNDTLFSTDNKRLVYYDEGLRQFSDYKAIEFKSRFLTSATYNNKTYVAIEGKALYEFKDGIVTPVLSDDNASISNILIEDKSSIWCVADNVLTHYKLLEDGRYVKQNYREINGLLVDDLKDIALKNNHLHLATDDGLMVINIEDITDSSKFSTYIKSVKINGKSVSKDSLELPYDKNRNLNIDFGAINYANASQTHFEYQLYPIQDNWVTTTAGEINLSNLEPNDYNLKMKVFDDENESVITLPISIKPLWWQTLWFKLFAILCAVTLVAVASRYFAKQSEFKRNQKIFEDKRLSELQLNALRSQMNPHFVFNSLSAIQYYINSNDIEGSERYLVKFSKLIRQFFELSKANDITINDEANLLTNYLEIEKLRFKEKLSFNIEINEAMDANSLMIPTMLLQPIVENAVNHGVFNKEDNGSVTVIFSKFKNSIKAEVIDDGVGFANTVKSTKDKIKSSHVLKDRLHFLNQSGKWKIDYSETEAYPNADDKGNISTFIIKKLA